MTDLYKLPFTLTFFQKLKRKFKKQSVETARPYLRRVYLSLDFLKNLNLDPQTLDLKAFYKSTSLAPTLLANNKHGLNAYLTLCNSEYQDNMLMAEGKPQEAKPANSVLLGYRHFDKWKFADGSEVGLYLTQDQKTLERAVRIQRLVQRQALGFKKYWFLRLLGKI